MQKIDTHVVTSQLSLHSQRYAYQRRHMNKLEDTYASQMICTQVRKGVDFDLIINLLNY